MFNIVAIMLHSAAEIHATSFIGLSCNSSFSGNYVRMLKVVELFGPNLTSNRLNPGVEGIFFFLWLFSTSYNLFCPKVPKFFQSQ